MKIVKQPNDVIFLYWGHKQDEPLRDPTIDKIVIDPGIDKHWQHTCISLDLEHPGPNLFVSEGAKALAHGILKACEIADEMDIDRLTKTKEEYITALAEAEKHFKREHIDSPDFMESTKKHIENINTLILEKQRNLKISP